MLPVAPPVLGDRGVTLAPDSKGFDTSTFSTNRNYLTVALAVLGTQPIHGPPFASVRRPTPAARFAP